MQCFVVFAFVVVCFLSLCARLEAEQPWLAAQGLVLQQQHTDGNFMYSQHCKVPEHVLTVLLFTAARAASDKVMYWHISILYWYIIRRQHDQ